MGSYIYTIFEKLVQASGQSIYSAYVVRGNINAIPKVLIVSLGIHAAKAMNSERSYTE
jgi:hypothetical protein